MMSITQSALNRLLNLMDELEPMPPEGEMLEQAIMAPPVGAATPEGAAVAVGAAQGEGPLDSLLGGL